MYRRLLIIPILLALPLICGCLTTLAVSAIAGSGSGTNNEHLETAKDTARVITEKARDTADDLSLSAHDAFESLSGSN